MNQLNQFFQQMRTLVGGMTPQSRLMAVLLSLGIIVSTVYLVQGYATGSGAMVYVFDGKPLSDPDLDKIEIALSVAGLRGHDRVGNRMKIPIAAKDTYYKAISEGKRSFARVCVVTDTPTPTSPCGACRQLLWEFCGDIDVVMANLQGLLLRKKMSELFPLPFDHRSL